MKASVLCPLLVLFALLASMTACVGLDGDVYEFEMTQRSIGNIPHPDMGFDVWMEVGDVERGRRVEDVEIWDEDDDVTLVSVDRIVKGESVDFDYKGRTYRLVAVRFIDRSPTFGDPFPDDEVIFTIERLASAPAQP